MGPHQGRVPGMTLLPVINLKLHQQQQKLTSYRYISRPKQKKLIEGSQKTPKNTIHQQKYQIKPPDYKLIFIVNLLKDATYP